MPVSSVWTNPTTWTSGQTLNADGSPSMNEQLSSNLLFLYNGHGFRAYRTAAFSLTNNTVSDLQFDAEDYDSDGYFTAPAYTVTIPAGLGGLYVCEGSITLAANATGSRSIFLKKNGTSFAQEQLQASADPATISRTAQKRFADGDTFGVSARQKSGTTLAGVTGSDLVIMAMTRIGA
jgi:hypothetical protein